MVEEKNEVLSYDTDFLPEFQCCLRIALLYSLSITKYGMYGSSDFALHVIHSFAGFKSTHSIFR